MTIKEVEKELGISRASIRFYEKKCLLRPDREDNTYRNYSEKDIAVLKKIIVFRKIGLSVADIEALLSGKASLSEKLEKNMIQLKEQIDELNGALKISKEIKNRNENFDSFDEDYWYEEIYREEKMGNKFPDIAKDVLQYEKKLIFEKFDIADSEGKLRYSKKEAVIKAVKLCLLSGIIYCLLGLPFDSTIKGVKGFLYGFTFPFIGIFFGTVFGLPLYFLGKKHSAAARVIRRIGWILYGILIVIAAALLIWLAATGNR